MLLNEFEQIAESFGCQTAMLETDPDKPLAQQLAPHLHRILLRLDRIKKAGADMNAAFNSLRAFASVFKVQLGELEFGLASAQGTGDLVVDLTDLFVAIGEAAKKTRHRRRAADRRNPIHRQSRSRRTHHGAA